MSPTGGSAIQALPSERILFFQRDTNGASNRESVPFGRQEVSLGAYVFANSKASVCGKSICTDDCSDGHRWSNRTTLSGCNKRHALSSLTRTYDSFGTLLAFWISIWSIPRKSSRPTRSTTGQFVFSWNQIAASDRVKANFNQANRVGKYLHREAIPVATELFQPKVCYSN